MSNREGYSDRTAEIAIGNVLKQKRAERKRRHKFNGNTRCTKTEEGPKIRQHQT